MSMENTTENRKIEIGQDSLNQLNTTRKWAMFIAIIGFIFLGLFIVIGALAGTFLSAFSKGDAARSVPEILVFILLILIAIINFFPVLFLFRFSKHIHKTIQTLDKEELRKAIVNLKAFFLYLGILIIVVLSFYVVALIVAGTSMAFLKGL
jgi:MFS family permease